MSQRKSDLSKKIKACTTTYPAAFLNSLPSGVQEFFTNKSHLSVLESVCGITNYNRSSVNSQLSNMSISGNRFQPDLITYYQLHDNVTKNEIVIGKLSVLGITNFYASNVRQDKYKSVSGFLTVLNAHCTPQQFQRSGIARELLSWGSDIQPQKITLQQLDLYFMRVLNTFATSSALRHDHKDFYKFAIVIGLSSLLCLGKTFTSTSIDNFFNSKWETLASHVGCEKFTARKPNAENCNAIHHFFTYKNTSTVFELYRSLSKQQNNGFKTAFEFIVESLRWANMEYIHLIDKYIVEENPELLSFQWNHYFGSEKIRMKSVYKLMEQLPESDHPFLKLLFSYSEYSEITQKNFQFLYGAARAVACIDNPSMNLIDRGDSEHIKNMKIQIKSYVMNKKAQNNRRA